MYPCVELHCVSGLLLRLQVEHAHNMIQERFIHIIERAGVGLQATPHPASLAATVDFAIEPTSALSLQGLYHVSIVRGAGGDCDSVGHSICVKADELHATLIAMAAHNMGRLVRFLVGSVPLRLSCSCSCSCSCSLPRPCAAECCGGLL